MKRTINTLLLTLLFWSLGMPNAAADNHAQSRPMSIADCMSFAVENAEEKAVLHHQTRRHRYRAELVASDNAPARWQFALAS